MINYAGQEWAQIKTRLEERKKLLMEQLTGPDKTERETQLLRGQIREVTGMIQWEAERAQPLNLSR